MIGKVVIFNYAKYNNTTNTSQRIEIEGIVLDKIISTGSTRYLIETVNFGILAISYSDIIKVL